MRVIVASETMRMGFIIKLVIRNDITDAFMCFLHGIFNGIRRGVESMVLFYKDYNFLFMTEWE